MNCQTEKFNKLVSILKIDPFHFPDDFLISKESLTESKSYVKKFTYDILNKLLSLSEGDLVKLRNSDLKNKINFEYFNNKFQ